VYHFCNLFMRNWSYTSVDKCYDLEYAGFDPKLKGGIILLDMGKKKG